MMVLSGSMYSATLRGKTHLTVLLPSDSQDYGDGTPIVLQSPYKTLYLLHGMGGDDSDWITHTDLSHLAKRNGFCVVRVRGKRACRDDQTDLSALLQTRGYLDHGCLDGWLGRIAHRINLSWHLRPVHRPFHRHHGPPRSPSLLPALSGMRDRGPVACREQRYCPSLGKRAPHHRRRP